MCLAVPGQIVEIVDAQRRVGRVEILGAPRLVNLGIVEDAAPGDWVLVQVGVAVARLDESEARETLRLLDELQAAFVPEADDGASGEGDA